MTIFPKVIYRLNIIPIKIPAGFNAEIDKVILKFLWKCKGSKTVKNLKKNKAEVTYPNFKTYYQTTVIKIV